MIILKYSLAIFCLLLTGCSFFSSHKEKESPALTKYEYTPEDIQAVEECSIILPHRRTKRNSSLHGFTRTRQYN